MIKDPIEILVVLELLQTIGEENQVDSTTMLKTFFIWLKHFIAVHNTSRVNIPLLD